MDENKSQSQAELKERIRRLYAFSELDNTPQSWKVYYFSREVYLVIRSLFPGRFSLLRFIAWRVGCKVSYHYDSFKVFLHRLGWCAERDNEGRCVICDPFYDCDCGECDEDLELLLKEYVNDKKTVV